MAGQTREQQRAERVAQARAAQARQERRRRLAIAGGSIAAVVVVLAALVLIGLTHDSSSSGSGASAAPASVVAAVTSVSQQQAAAIGDGGTKNSILPLDGKPLKVGDKPLILDIGAEYCPFCAAERWSTVLALSRFGTWSGLKQTTSAAEDVHPNTPTFSFSGATLKSDYLVFQGVETATNKRVGNSYEPLDKLTAEQQRLVTTYNAPPYVPEQSAGAIPFTDFAGAFAASGAGYDPSLLKGKTLQQIADEVKAGTSPAAKAIIGHANRLTAAICVVTGGQPASVCRAEPVTSLAKTLPNVG
jgi:thiol-disulfide isomerase/thioredoxin